MEVSLRRRRLAAELKRLREEAHLSLDDVAEMTDIGRSSVSRIESTYSAAKVVYVKALVAAYKVPEAEAQALIQLAREALNTKGWWSGFANALTAHHLEYISFENEAKSVLTYELVVPGLLQTEDYARVMGRTMAVPPLSEEEIEQRVASRMKRQHRLVDDNPIDLWAIVDESALRRPTGGREIMLAQLDHLHKMSQLPNVTFQVIGNELGAHVGMIGAFSILRFEHGQDVAYCEGVGGETWLEGEETMRRTTLMFEHLRASALDVDTSRERLRAAAKELRR